MRYSNADYMKIGRLEQHMLTYLYYYTSKWYMLRMWECIRFAKCHDLLHAPAIRIHDPYFIKKRSFQTKRTEATFTYRKLHILIPLNKELLVKFWQEHKSYRIKDLLAPVLFFWNYKQPTPIYSLHCTTKRPFSANWTKNMKQKCTEQWHKCIYQSLGYTMAQMHK